MIKVRKLFALCVGLFGSLVTAVSAFATAATDGPSAVASFVPDVTSVWGIVGLVLAAAAVLYVVRKLIKTGNRC